jgi:hypothetical protein
MCPVCQARAAAVGVLCLPCRDEIASPVPAIPEQIQPRGEGSTDAVLIDVWGRPHLLAPSTLIGRGVEEQGLAILEVSISRHHARIVLEDGAWSVRDLGSANGTFVDGQRVEGAAALHPGARVRFGQMTFYFLPGGVSFGFKVVEASTALLPRLSAERLGQIQVGRELEEERTDPGELPSISLKLHEPTGGGGGFVELDGKRVQLTATQLELVTLMVQRMTTDTAAAPPVRGFVRSSELIAALSWDTSEPNENHVKQLVRRVRRALMKVAHGDLIESRHRFGYRLRAIPRAD